MIFVHVFFSAAGSVAIKPGSPEEQAIADHRERGLSYTETTLLINRQCLQDERPTVTRSAVCTYELNMVRQENSTEKRPQGNKDADSNKNKDKEISSNHRSATKSATTTTNSISNEIIDTQTPRPR